MMGFFQEDNGNYSCIRLMSFIALVASIAFGSITLINPKAKDVGVPITFSFLSVAFASKAIQKVVETKV